MVSLSKSCTGSSATALARTVTSHPGSKEWNDFYSPMFEELNNLNSKTSNNNGEFEFQLQIGSSLYPEYRIRSHAEA
ncbi:MAG: hypothetical protein ACKPKO_51010 [Candidatus Fonsibacter sp.]